MVLFYSRDPIKPQVLTPVPSLQQHIQRPSVKRAYCPYTGSLPYSRTQGVNVMCWKRPVAYTNSCSASSYPPNYLSHINGTDYRGNCPQKTPQSWSFCCKSQSSHWKWRSTGKASWVIILKAWHGMVHSQGCFHLCLIGPLLRTACRPLFLSILTSHSTQVFWMTFNDGSKF